MTIRRAKPEDAEFVGTLIKSLSHHYLGDVKSPLPEPFSNTLTTSECRKRIDDPAYLCFVYLMQDDPVGYIAVRDRQHLYHLFVDEHVHGRGVAAALWGHVLEYLALGRITVNASLNAIAVYRKFGFTETGPIREQDGLTFQPMQQFH